MTKPFLAALLTAAALAAQGAAGQQVATPVASSAPFVPVGFNPPTLVETPRFKLVPLGPALVDRDYQAYMSSIDHLQRTFSRSTKWPHAGITHVDAVKDMAGEQARFADRRAFDYAVLTPDGSRELGSVYISPSRVAGYDAVVRLWVTKERYDAGFDAELYAWVRTWVRSAWPFRHLAYPGRAIDWRTWNGLTAAK